MIKLRQLKIIRRLWEERGGKSRTHFQNDPKNFVLFYHLQFQYWFMESQLQQVQVLARSECLQGTLHQKNMQLGDLALSPPITTREHESTEANQAAKLLPDPAKSTNKGPGDNQAELYNESENRRSLKGNSQAQQIEAKNQLQHKQISKSNNLGLNQLPANIIKSQIASQDPEIPQVQNLASEHKLQGSNQKKRKKQKNYYYYDEQDYSQAVSAFKFPFVNEYLRNHSQQYLKTLQVFDKTKDALKRTISSSFINCDVRYFNWKLFTQQVGKFDVVLIDPPWRIKGAQQNDSQFMFSNCKFSLQYNTMANSQIKRIPLHILSDQGFIFLWILNSQLDASLQIMEEWGYQLVEEVIWVKLKDQKISLTHGYYFMHSYEVCLVGYKCKRQKMNNRQLKVRQEVSWNTIFAEVRQKSQKPEDLYALIDIIFKGGKKIEIFARNHNLRFGIFSVGNELGQSYDKWLLRLSCDQCGETLAYGEKRFKSKHKPNYDLCYKCIPLKDRTHFFELTNDVDQNIKHQYISCNHCGIQPIWGIRFQCITCHDFDICQNCFDRNLHQQHNFHPLDHEFIFLEVPVFGNGFHIHESKCSSCYQNPIIGIYFSCQTCRNFKLCQKCYFQRPTNSFSSLMKRHKPDHQLEAIFESQIQQDKRYQCFSCKRQVLEHCWMCQNCYNFFFCEKCYQKRAQFKSLYANTHKKYHVLTKIF